MKERLEETHGPAVELVRHFLARFFDNEMVAIPGEWQKVAVGIFASLVSLGFPTLDIYWQRYKHLHELSFATYREGVREDLITFVVLAMAVTALLTVLQWQSLFPSLRDCLALAGLPVSPREVFLAKFGSLVLVFSVFVLAMTALPSMLFAIVIGLKWHENPSWWVNAGADFAALAGVCVFVFFALLALQGILLHLLPGRAFERVSLVVQALLFIVTVGAIPLIGRQPTAAPWWPPVWFVHLWEAIVTGPAAAARPALLAMAIPVALSVAAHLLSYHRYRKMLLEARSGPGSAMGEPGIEAAGAVDSRSARAGCVLLHLEDAGPEPEPPFAAAGLRGRRAGMDYEGPAGRAPGVVAGRRALWPSLDFHAE